MVLWENLFISLHSYSYIKTLFSELPFFSQLQVNFNGYKLIKSETDNTFCSLWKLKVRAVIIYVNAFCHHVPQQLKL